MFLCVFQDYLLSHMYSNAARDDLWSKLSQVTLTWTVGQPGGGEGGWGGAVAPLAPTVGSRRQRATLTFHIADDLTRQF